MDILRKLIHMLMGLFALALRWLNPWQAMLCALLAFLHNLYIFPLYGRKKLEKDEEKKRGYTAIVSYPAVVFFLILLSYLFCLTSRDSAMPLAAASWAILAFGDALGGIFGMSLKGPKLPWNKEKTFSGLFSFVAFSSIAAFLGYAFVSGGSFPDLLKDARFLSVILLAAPVSAIVESLDGQFDDNIGFPFVALSILSFYPLYCLPPAWTIVRPVISAELNLGVPLLAIPIAVAINLLLATTALLKKWVSLWGFVFGLLVGFSVIFSLGAKGFAILCMFYLFANFSTFYGRKIKEERGIAEGNKGTRGLGSVFSKGLAPAVFCWLSFEAFAAALAFYAADTVATEFGKTSRKGTFSIFRLKSVSPGTVGAVSVKGTIAGAFSIVIFLFLAMSFMNFRAFEDDLKITVVLSALVFIFFILESLVNELNSKHQVTSKPVIHVTLGFLIGALANALMIFLWMMSVWNVK
ncbi:MAG TPA: DUF92 domain-containing protein [Acidobacteriota bacterium]|nr:DUF92 domain-containing protein [Acidobacteriota bacterium]HNT18070.1 DUF92 domain-containing protein [Acidobacteriota bacterium]HPA27517.1 DUF92 domain-containing protein [Acidobacteriota bacterium]HQO21168.1 DUF92 domain-containing protein [Acidobacteriota bacterium]HQQ47907.1 DUF92 domain-containing protein [Acidobacteriota bacterium]